MYKLVLNGLFFMFSISSLSAQNKHDYVWVFGYESSSVDPLFGGSFMDFNFEPVRIYSEDHPLFFNLTNASVCDGNGKLAFYTSGVFIANGAHEFIENGDDLAAGARLGWDEMLPITQGAIVLTFPQKEDAYNLIHIGLSWNSAQGVSGSPLLHTIVDMKDNNGKGRVIKKNGVITEALLAGGRLTATRHANGRDWWVVNAGSDDETYYKHLVTPDTIFLNDTQEMESIIWDGLGAAVFAPDGSKYVFFTQNNIEKNYVYLYDFDRCTGQLSNELRIELLDAPPEIKGGVSISSNSRFLYVSSYYELYQFDLLAEDIEHSVDTIAIYDEIEYKVPGFDSLFLSTGFSYAQLAPDGKIYINTTGATNLLHVIHQPNLKGDSYQFEIRGVELPTLNSFSMPNFPNYRLGALEGSPCDTLELDQIVAYEEIQTPPPIPLFPNPAVHELTINLREVPGQVRFDLYEISGRRVLERQLQGGIVQSLDIGGVEAGIYHAVIRNGEGVLKREKVVVVER